MKNILNEKGVIIMVDKKNDNLYWHRIIDKQLKSGMSASAFCREHNISPHQFYRRRRKLQNNDVRSFLELVPCSRPVDSGIKVHFPTGMFIDIQLDFDPQALRSVLHILNDR